MHRCIGAATIATAVFFSAGPVQSGELTREHFRDTATVSGDELDTTVTVDTVQGDLNKNGLVDGEFGDVFLRAFIDKKTGARRFQVYQSLLYRSTSWHFFTLANHEAQGAPKAVALTVIGRDVSCTGSRRRGCFYTEQFAFTVDEPLLRWAAGAGGTFDFKFKAKSGYEYRSSLRSEEIAGFLDRIDGLSQSSAGALGAATAKAVTN